MTQYQDLQQRIQNALLSLSQRAEDMASQAHENAVPETMPIDGGQEESQDLQELRAKLTAAEASYQELHTRLAKVEEGLKNGDVQSAEIEAQYKAQIAAQEARFELFYKEASVIAAALGSALDIVSDAASELTEQ